MTPEQVLNAVLALDADLVLRGTWGESSVFHNPGGASAHGAYVLTVKRHDGPNDRASRLGRDGVHRVSVGLTREVYAGLFGPPPRRPGRGGVVNTGHDFAELGAWLPHPVYAWMGWACINSPTEADWSELLRLAGVGIAKARGRKRRA